MFPLSLIPFLLFFCSFVHSAKGRRVSDVCATARAAAMDAMLLEWQRRLPIRFRRRRRSLRTDERTDGRTRSRRVSRCVTQTNAKSMRKIDALLSVSAAAATTAMLSVGGWAPMAGMMLCTVRCSSTPVTYELNGSEQSSRRNVRAARPPEMLALISHFHLKHH